MKNKINKLKRKLGLLQMDKFALTPYRDYAEAFDELSQINSSILTTKEDIRQSLRQTT